jgi:hypothetical protein
MEKTNSMIEKIAVFGGRGDGEI